MSFDPSSILGGLIGGIGSAYAANKQLQAQREANKTNLQIARENNQWNRESASIANDWNIAQWQRENEYNSASAQVQRFRDAGLNPYLSITGGANAGTASSLQSSEAAPASDVGKQMPVDYSSVMQASQYFAQLPKQLAEIESIQSNTDRNNAEARVFDEQAKQLGYTNIYQERMAYNALQKLIADLDVSKETKQRLLKENELKQMDIDMLGDHEVWNARKQEYIQHARLLGESASSQELDAMIKRRQLPFIVPQERARISVMLGNAAAAYAAAGLSRKLAEESMARTFKQQFDNKVLKKISDEDIEKLSRAIVNEAYGSSEYTKVRGEKAGTLIQSDIYNNYVTGTAGLINAGTNAYGTYYDNQPMTYEEATDQIRSRDSRGRHHTSTRRVSTRRRGR